ncbi:uncharacterized protein DUF2834 [Palleronia aestuarii]|uniref:Uncharacterized protein DUF2834 n=1 Tax=Palleronia aestuarii TaxID=568105 RepID=A0A2W7NIT0_9RHOB|nr:DUF2834 domain-containing protein [Palleronia aestuarii]PZX16604.1 uncharacterized protein DUF2834 [Palleronia aestuarii]
MRWVFLALAAWGAVHPMWHFTRYLAEGNSWGQMIGAWYANASVTGLTWDLTIAAISFTIWVLWESLTTGHRKGLAAIPATFLIGLSCGLPLYLFLRFSRSARV